MLKAACLRVLIHHDVRAGARSQAIEFPHDLEDFGHLAISAFKMPR